MINKKERLVGLAVRVSPKAIENLDYLQKRTGASLSDVLRAVIDEGLEVEKERIEH